MLNFLSSTFELMWSRKVSMSKPGCIILSLFIIIFSFGFIGCDAAEVHLVSSFHDPDILENVYEDPWAQIHSDVESSKDVNLDDFFTKYDGIERTIKRARIEITTLKSTQSVSEEALPFVSPLRRGGFNMSQNAPDQAVETTEPDDPDSETSPLAIPHIITALATLKLEPLSSTTRIFKTSGPELLETSGRSADKSTLMLVPTTSAPETTTVTVRRHFSSVASGISTIMIAGQTDRDNDIRSSRAAAVTSAGTDEGGGDTSADIGDEEDHSSPASVLLSPSITSGPAETTRIVPAVHSTSRLGSPGSVALTPHDGGEAPASTGESDSLLSPTSNAVVTRMSSASSLMRSHAAVTSALAVSPNASMALGPVGSSPAVTSLHRDEEEDGETAPDFEDSDEEGRSSSPSLSVSKSSASSPAETIASVLSTAAGLGSGSRSRSSGRLTTQEEVGETSAMTADKQARLSSASGAVSVSTALSVRSSPAATSHHDEEEDGETSADIEDEEGQSSSASVSVSKSSSSSKESPIASAQESTAASGLSSAVTNSEQQVSRTTTIFEGQSRSSSASNSVSFTMTSSEIQNFDASRTTAVATSTSLGIKSPSMAATSSRVDEEDAETSAAIEDEEGQSSPASMSSTLAPETTMRSSFGQTQYIAVLTNIETRKDVVKTSAVIKEELSSTSSAYKLSDVSVFFSSTSPASTSHHDEEEYGETSADIEDEEGQSSSASVSVSKSAMTPAASITSHSTVRAGSTILEDIGETSAIFEGDQSESPPATSAVILTVTRGETSVLAASPSAISPVPNASTAPGVEVVSSYPAATSRRVDKLEDDGETTAVAPQSTPSNVGIVVSSIEVSSSSVKRSESSSELSLKFLSPTQLWSPVGTWESALLTSPRDASVNQTTSNTYPRPMSPLPALSATIGWNVEPSVVVDKSEVEFTSMILISPKAMESTAAERKPTFQVELSGTTTETSDIRVTGSSTLQDDMTQTSTSQVFAVDSAQLNRSSELQQRERWNLTYTIIPESFVDKFRNSSMSQFQDIATISSRNMVVEATNVLTGVFYTAPGNETFFPSVPASTASPAQVTVAGQGADMSASAAAILQLTSQKTAISAPIQTALPTPQFSILNLSNSNYSVMVLQGMESIGPVKVFFDSVPLGVPEYTKQTEYQFANLKFVIPAFAWSSRRRAASALTLTVFELPLSTPNMPGKACGPALSLGPIDQVLSVPILVTLPCSNSEHAGFNSAPYAFRPDVGGSGGIWAAEHSPTNQSTVPDALWAQVERMGILAAFHSATDSASAPLARDGVSGTSASSPTVIATLTVGAAAIITLSSLCIWRYRRNVAAKLMENKSGVMRDPARMRRSTVSCSSDCNGRVRSISELDLNTEAGDEQQQYEDVRQVDPLQVQINMVRERPANLDAISDGQSPVIPGIEDPPLTPHLSSFPELPVEATYVSTSIHQHLQLPQEEAPAWLVEGNNIGMRTEGHPRPPPAPPFAPEWLVGSDLSEQTVTLLTTPGTPEWSDSQSPLRGLVSESLTVSPLPKQRTAFDTPRSPQKSFVVVTTTPEFTTMDQIELTLAGCRQQVAVTVSNTPRVHMEQIVMPLHQLQDELQCAIRLDQVTFDLKSARDVQDIPSQFTSSRNICEDCNPPSVPADLDGSSWC